MDHGPQSSDGHEIQQHALIPGTVYKRGDNSVVDNSPDRRSMSRAWLLDEDPDATANFRPDYTVSITGEQKQMIQRLQALHDSCHHEAYRWIFKEVGSREHTA
jgi:hypothetical protein